MASSLTMHLIEQSWQIIQLLLPFTILLYTGRIIQTADLSSVTSSIQTTLTTLPHLLMRERRHLVYGVAAGGIIAAANPAVPFLDLILAAAIIGHGLVTHRTITEGEQTTIAEQVTGAIAILAAIIAILTWSSLAQTLAAVAILGIIFWRV